MKHQQALGKIRIPKLYKDYLKCPVFKKKLQGTQTVKCNPCMKKEKQSTETECPHVLNLAKQSNYYKYVQSNEESNV